MIPDTQPISIPTYRMSKEEILELKKQLKYLLERMIHKAVMSSKGAQIFLFESAMSLEERVLTTSY